jgi:hypothetical protein
MVEHKGELETTGVKAIPEEPQSSLSAGPDGTDVPRPDLDWLTLRFRDQKIECDFQQVYARHSPPHFRRSILFAAAMYGAFGLLDFSIMPETKAFAWMVRYAIVCPAALIAVLLSFRPFFAPYCDAAWSILALLAGFGVIAIIVRAGPPENHFYYAGLMLVCAFVYTYARLRFIIASATAWTIVLGYEIAGAWIHNASGGSFISNTSFLVALNGIGMTAAYSMERYQRVDYFQRRLILRQTKELRQALADVNVLSGLLPTCAWCKKIRDDQGYWNQIEDYVSRHSAAVFSHGICPDCAAAMMRSIPARESPPSPVQEPGLIK